MGHLSLLISSFFLFLSVIHALPKLPLQARYPDGVPALPFPPSGNDQNCPTAYTNLFNQGVQKRDLLSPESNVLNEGIHGRDIVSKEEQRRQALEARALEPRQYSHCIRIAHFEWTGFSRPLGNTQDLFLFGGSTYTFVVSCSASIKLAYAWTAPFASDHYTLIGTGGNGGNTATIQIVLEADSHVHFEALSDYTMSSGAAAVFKQDY